MKDAKKLEKLNQEKKQKKYEQEFKKKLIETIYKRKGNRLGQITKLKKDMKTARVRKNYYKMKDKVSQLTAQVKELEELSKIFGE